MVLSLNGMFCISCSLYGLSQSIKRSFFRTKGMFDLDVRSSSVIFPIHHLEWADEYKAELGLQQWECILASPLWWSSGTVGKNLNGKTKENPLAVQAWKKKKNTLQTLIMSMSTSELIIWLSVRGDLVYTVNRVINLTKCRCLLQEWDQRHLICEDWLYWQHLLA